MYLGDATLEPVFEELERRKPANGTRRSPQADLEQQFAGNSFLAPGRILVRHAPDELTELQGSSRAIGGGVISYQIDGKQYVATTSGVVSGFFGGSGTPSVIVFALP